MPEAGNYIRANEISITDLVSPVFKDVVNRAEERILEAIKTTKVSDKSGENRDVEIMSFPVALMLVQIYEFESFDGQVLIGGSQAGRVLAKARR